METLKVSTLKIIVGLACMVISLFLGLFAWASFAGGPLWFKFIPAVFALGVAATGLFLIFRRASPLSKLAKAWITVLFSVLIVGSIGLDVCIRTERKTLQNRAKEFLLRPVPEMFKTDSIGGYQARPNETVLSTSRRLIERYASNGRMRWSAAIQGQFAVQPFETAACEDAAKTNEEARLYTVACKAIIDNEWEMGFWQWVQDSIEMRGTIPEIEEEDRIDRFIQRVDGTWTNDSGTMSVFPNGTFSAAWWSKTQTNFLKGRQVFRGSDKVLMVYPDGPSGTSMEGEKDFRIIHVDDHNLIYEIDSQTSSMGR